ncbi:MAG: sugar ABC transporter permease [Dorea sp.]|nr:sugar ABC transporter permease [Dorea sp.]
MTNKRSKRKKLLLLIPTGIMILVLSLYPTLRGIYLGFTNYRVGRPIEFNGVDNYVGIYNSGYLGIIFKNIGLMLLISVIAIYVISLALALLLNSEIPFRGLWRALLIIPWAVPPIAKISMWKAVFNPVCGYLNAYLLKLHLIDQAVNWTTDINFAKYTVITVFVWGCVPFTALSLLATLQQVPTDIHEAAVLDGANSVKYFRYIVLPYLNQTTAITMSLVVVWIMNDFSSQYLLTKGGPGSATLTPMVEAYRQGFTYGNFGFASAYGNTMIVCVSVLIFIYIKSMNARDKGVN